MTWVVLGGSFALAYAYVKMRRNRKAQAGRSAR
jgi:hypothetical protein